LLLIANIASPGSMRNILARPEVCISFVDVFSQKGFKVKGIATVARVGDPSFATYCPPLFDLAGPLFPFSSIFVIDVQSVDQIIAPSYRLFPTRKSPYRLSRPCEPMASNPYESGG
jgi:hypothetical protein